MSKCAEHGLDVGTTARLLKAAKDWNEVISRGEGDYGPGIIDVIRDAIAPLDKEMYKNRANRQAQFNKDFNASKFWSKVIKAIKHPARTAQNWTAGLFGVGGNAKY